MLQHIQMNRREIIIAVVMAALAAIMVLFLAPDVFATDTSNAATTMFTMIINIVCVIVIILGVIFCIMGVVKFAIAHANEQGPEQQKAAMMLATGIVLIILPIIINANKTKLAKLITDAAKSYTK